MDVPCSCIIAFPSLNPLQLTLLLTMVDPKNPGSKICIVSLKTQLFESITEYG